MSDNDPYPVNCWCHNHRREWHARHPEVHDPYTCDGPDVKPSWLLVGLMVGALAGVFLLVAMMTLGV